MTTAKRLLLIGVAAATIGLIAGILSPVQQSADAAVGSDFDAGYIISDANFYDSNSMSASDIQSFLNTKVPTCDTWHTAAYGQNPPFTCLKDYSTSVSSVAANAYCSAISAGTYSAAQTIDSVARACGISQKVLLVMLQKEQGLVSDTWPLNTQYDKAMGYACPDGAPCDTKYYGLFNQVYSAARQFKVYAAYPASFGYRAGATNHILYTTNTECGTKSVYIQNQATASLYIYTPYTPNEAALNNLYGEGDGCSSYGNRNFWRIYSDWFGSPTNSTPIGAKWWQLGGPSGWLLGPATTSESCTIKNNGCYQLFQNGRVLYSPTTGAHYISGENLGVWAAQGNENGPLGYPTTDPVCSLPAGCYQSFEGGTITYSPSGGAHILKNGIGAKWWQLGGPASWLLGYPTTDESCTIKNNGCYQLFQNGRVLYSPTTGAHYISGENLGVWAAQGNENGPLGYPTTDPVCSLPAGCYQSFEGGTITYSPSGGAHILKNGIGAKWWQLGGPAESSPLGYPTTDESCTLKNNGCYQNFPTGQIHYSPATGVHYTIGAIRDLWVRQGYENGPLGYPTTDPVCSLPAGCYQSFEGGTITYSPSGGAHILKNGIGAKWWQLGGPAESSPLGYPTTDESCTLKNNGCYQNFPTGQIHYSPATGVHYTIGAIRDLWVRQGYENGPLGYPTTDPVCSPSGGCSQDFEGGTLTSK